MKETESLVHYAHTSWEQRGQRLGVLWVHIWIWESLESVYWHILALVGPLNLHVEGDLGCGHETGWGVEGGCVRGGVGEEEGSDIFGWDVFGSRGGGQRPSAAVLAPEPD